jgi:hypothetical protein
MRRNALPIIVVSVALLLAATVAEAAKSPARAPFKTGQYTGKVSSKLSGTTVKDALTMSLTKSGKKYLLRTGYVARATCGGSARSQTLLFKTMTVGKRTGKFSGKTIDQFPGGKIRGRAKGKKITGSWSYSNGSCRGSGTLSAKRK